MSERYTLQQIQEMYPNSWVGLCDVKRVSGEFEVESAKIRYPGNTKTMKELHELLFTTEQDLQVIYTGDPKDLYPYFEEENIKNGVPTGRFTMDEIKQMYPKSWVGLYDVIYKPTKGISIESAKIRYPGNCKTKSELLQLVIFGGERYLSREYTGPEDLEILRI